MAEGYVYAVIHLKCDRPDCYGTVTRSGRRCRRASPCPASAGPLTRRSSATHPG